MTIVQFPDTPAGRSGVGVVVVVVGVVVVVVGVVVVVVGVVVVVVGVVVAGVVVVGVADVAVGVVVVVDGTGTLGVVVVGAADVAVGVGVVVVVDGTGTLGVVVVGVRAGCFLRAGWETRRGLAFRPWCAWCLLLACTRCSLVRDRCVVAARLAVSGPPAPAATAAAVRTTARDEAKMGIRSGPCELWGTREFAN
jgi:hypothetical protein